MGITIRNESTIPLVVQLGTIGVHRSAHLKSGEEVHFTVGPGAFGGWTIWAHMSVDDKDDTTWGDVLVGPIVALGTVLLSAVTAGIGAYMAAGIGAMAMVGPVAIVGEAAAAAAGTSLLTDAVVAQLKEAITEIPIGEDQLRLRSMGWKSLFGQRCKITGGVKLHLEFEKDDAGNPILKNTKNIGTPLVATKY